MRFRRVARLSARAIVAGRTRIKKRIKGFRERTPESRNLAREIEAAKTGRPNQLPRTIREAQAYIKILEAVRRTYLSMKQGSPLSTQRHMGKRAALCSAKIARLETLVTEAEGHLK